MNIQSLLPILSEMLLFFFPGWI